MTVGEGSDQQASGRGTRAGGGAAVGTRVKRARESLGWSLRELGRQSDVPHGYLWRIEHGEVALPSPITLRKLAVALGVDGLYGELMALAGYVPPA